MKIYLFERLRDECSELTCLEMKQFLCGMKDLSLEETNSFRLLKEAMIKDVNYEKTKAKHNFI